LIQTTVRHQALRAGIDINGKYRQQDVEKLSNLFKGVSDIVHPFNSFDNLPAV